MHATTDYALFCCRPPTACSINITPSLLYFVVILNPKNCNKGSLTVYSKDLPLVGENISRKIEENKMSGWKTATLNYRICLILLHYTLGGSFQRKYGIQFLEASTNFRNSHPYLQI